MQPVPPLAREAIELARAGDFEQALAKAREALSANPADGGLNLFAGLLLARLLRIPDAIGHFRAALAAAPGDGAARLELARALLANGDLTEAEAVLAQGPVPPREARKVGASLLAAKGEFAAAAAAFGALVEAEPRDFESWNHLGAALLSDGQPGAAASAFSESLKLRHEQPGIWDKWVDAVMAAGGGEAALQDLEHTGGDNALPAARLLDRLDRPDEAIARLAGRAETAEGLSALASMLERRNRIDELREVIERIARLDQSQPQLPLLRAKLALRSKDFAAARGLADQAPALVDPGTRLQILGEASDRLGEYDQAWAAYAAMNREDARANAHAHAEADAYLAELRAETETLTAQWAADWRLVREPAQRPIVLLGFPRSGTTLLDTFLGAHSALYVSEEYPLVPTVSHAAGPVAGLPRMSEQRIEELRTLYWATATRYLPDRGSLRLVDKYPFALVGAPYVERLFAGAPILFVQRHPCDVILSCFFTRFQPSGAAASFADLAQTAQLYDAMMRFWTLSRSLLPLRVLDVRYERMVENTEREMRAVAAFLDLPWTAELIENRAAAEKRGHIKTPSYAQVAEPVYRRSVERWRNYERELEPVLPLLKPWVKALDYTL